MKQPITRTRTYMRLGRNKRNKLGFNVPTPCRACGGVWKQVTETRRGKKLIRRRVTCYQCGKRQYGQRARVQ